MNLTPGFWTTGVVSHTLSSVCPPVSSLQSPVRHGSSLATPVFLSQVRLRSGSSTVPGSELLLKNSVEKRGEGKDGSPLTLVQVIFPLTWGLLSVYQRVRLHGYKKASPAPVVFPVLWDRCLPSCACTQRRNSAWTLTNVYQDPSRFPLH